MVKSTDEDDRKLIGRRALLGRGATVLSSLAVAQSLLAKPASAATAKGTKPNKAGTADGDTFTVVITGESMVYRSFSKRTDPQFLALIDMLRNADLAYTHLETTIAEPCELKWASHGAISPAGYLTSEPIIAKDMAWAGVDVMSIGQNHAFDWSEFGLYATIKHCNEAGIAVAGTGEDLEAARRPTFFEVPKGRMSLISVASGNSAFEWAGLPKGDIPGRPGVNPLRLKTIYEVPADASNALKAIGKNLNVLTDAQAAKPEFNITPGGSAGINGFSSFAFRQGDKFAMHTECHPGDVKDILRSVDEASKWSDLAMVAHHNSTSEGTRSTTPSEFVVDFAHKVIDGGADMYIGHGWHTFLGIEIYKEKPIFYGLGSFFVESQFMPRVPADQFESYGFNTDELTTLNPASGNLHPGAFFAGADWEWAPLYKLIYENKKLARIELYPVEMGYDFTVDPPKVVRTVGEGENKYLDGSPRLAVGANAQAILAKMQKINGFRGTKMDIVGEVGVITVG